VLSPSWQSDGPDGWPTSHIVWALVLGRKRLDFIVELFSSRAAARETLAGISGSLWICVKCVIEFLQLKCVVWNFQSSLSSDRTGGRNYQGLDWNHCKPNQFDLCASTISVVKLLAHMCGVATEPVNQIYLAEYLFVVNWVAAAA